MASKRPLDSDCPTPPAKIAKTRMFKDSWKDGNSWLRYEANSKSMFCNLCAKAQKSNIFTAGCNVLKKESVTKHANSKDHGLAASAAKQSSQMKVACTAAVKKNESAITTAMTNVYFAAKQNLASSVVPQLNELMLHQGVSQLADLKVDRHTSYSHSTSIADFQSAISSVLETDLLEKVTSSKKFSLMFDESTDVSVQQNIIVYIRILEPDSLGYVEPHTHFLGLDSLVKADAHTIYGKVKGLLSSKGIDLANLCGLSTDGASVMVGHKSGVVTRLKEDVPGVLATHCIAHRLALSCCTGADSIPYLVKFQEILNSVFKYFNNSPKNMACLESVQSHSPGQASRFKQVFHTRWLSFEGSVDAMVKNYSSLISVFLQEQSGRALSLHKPITCYKFLHVLHFMADVLKPLSILSKMYQQKDLDYCEVTPLLESTVSTLESLRSSPGESLGQFLEKVPTEPTTDSDGLVTFDFDGHTVRDGIKQRTEAAAICDKFVSGMIRSMNDRFTSNSDGSVLTALSNVFNPALDLQDKMEDVDVVSDYLATVGMPGYREEICSFVGFANASRAGGNKSVKSTRDVANLAMKHMDAYPASAEAAARLLVAPVSTVDCERGFSRQNVVKTGLRNSMALSALDNLMRISIEGPSLQSFDFKKAFKVWSGAKARRILQ